MDKKDVEDTDDSKSPKFKPKLPKGGKGKSKGPKSLGKPMKDFNARPNSFELPVPLQHVQNTI